MRNSLFQPLDAMRDLPDSATSFGLFSSGNYSTLPYFPVFYPTSTLLSHLYSTFQRNSLLFPFFALSSRLNPSVPLTSMIALLHHESSCSSTLELSSVRCPLAIYALLSYFRLMWTSLQPFIDPHAHISTDGPTCSINSRLLIYPWDPPQLWRGRGST